jgi:hypothetical protein
MLAVLTGVSASKSPTRIGSALAAAPATVAQTSAPATTTHKIIYDGYALMITASGRTSGRASFDIGACLARARDAYSDPHWLGSPN